MCGRSPTPSASAGRTRTDGRTGLLFVCPHQPGLRRSAAPGVCPAACPPLAMERTWLRGFYSEQYAAGDRYPGGPDHRSVTDPELTGAGGSDRDDLWAGMGYQVSTTLSVVYQLVSGAIVMGYLVVGLF